MEILLITTHLAAIGIGIFVGRLQKSQIKVQKEIIDSQQKFIEHFNWEKTKKHYEEVILPAERAKLRQEFLEDVRKVDEEFKFTVRQNEMKGYLFALFSYYEKDSPGQAKRIVEKQLPNSLQDFQGIWANDLPRTPAPENNAP